MMQWHFISASLESHVYGCVCCVAECTAVAGGKCLTCSGATTCTMVKCDVDKLDSNGLAADGCEAGLLTVWSRPTLGSSFLLWAVEVLAIGGFWGFSYMRLVTPRRLSWSNSWTSSEWMYNWVSGTRHRPQSDVQLDTRHGSNASIAFYLDYKLWAN